MEEEIRQITDISQIESTDPNLGIVFETVMKENMEESSEHRRRFSVYRYNNEWSGNTLTTLFQFFSLKLIEKRMVLPVEVFVEYVKKNNHLKKIARRRQWKRQLPIVILILTLWILAFLGKLGGYGAAALGIVAAAAVTALYRYMGTEFDIRLDTKKLSMEDCEQVYTLAAQYKEQSRKKNMAMAIVFGVLLCVVGGVGLSVEAVKSEKYMKAFQAAAKLKDEGKYQEAQMALNEMDREVRNVNINHIMELEKDIFLEASLGNWVCKLEDGEEKYQYFCLTEENFAYFSSETGLNNEEIQKVLEEQPDLVAEADICIRTDISTMKYYFKLWCQSQYLRENFRYDYLTDQMVISEQGRFDRVAE